MNSELRSEWVWWDREYSEAGLSGFHTKDDRDRFSAGKPGPFRRRVVKEGMHEISQIEDWSMMVKRMSREAGIE